MSQFMPDSGGQSKDSSKAGPEAYLSPDERKALQRSLSFPEDLPPRFKSWLIDFIAVNIPQIPISQIVGGGNRTVPSGVITAYAGSTAPTDWLLCDGSAVSRTGETAALFAAIGTVYGVGDGSTTFNLPDLRGRVAVGKGSNASVDALGENEGVAEANRRPQHRHTAHTHTYFNGSSFGGGTAGSGSAPQGSGSNTTGSADGGSGVAEDSLNAPAYQIVNYIIAK